MITNGLPDFIVKNDKVYALNSTKSTTMTGLRLSQTTYMVAYVSVEDRADALYTTPPMDYKHKAEELIEKFIADEGDNLTLLRFPLLKELDQKSSWIDYLIDFQRSAGSFEDNSTSMIEVLKFLDIDHEDLIAEQKLIEKYSISTKCPSYHSHDNVVINE